MATSRARLPAAHVIFDSELNDWFLILVMKKETLTRYLKKG